MAAAYFNPTGLSYALFILLMKDLAPFDRLSQAYVPVLTSFPKIPVNAIQDPLEQKHNQAIVGWTGFSLPQILE